MTRQPTRLAIIVSHPIQYDVPLYRRLAKRDGVDLKVFFTWHAAAVAQYDPGFQRDVVWDIPLTSGYEFELVPNASSRPGSDHFWGIRNPQLVDRVSRWRPDAVHITGYAYASHLHAMWAFHKRDIPVLFRGDSHLLDQKSGVRWQLKRLALSRIYKWPTACLCVGKNNYDYYRELGVPDSRLFYCPHAIEVDRFSEPNDELEEKARRWRNELKIPDEANAVLFAGKFQKVKRPIELMRTVAAIKDLELVLIMVGNGELEGEVQDIVRQFPERFRLLPFQNQSLMPVVYRIGDIFVLPSSSETWGLALNEAIACGRRVLASDKVGGAIDLIESDADGAVFIADNWDDFRIRLEKLLKSETDRDHLLQRARDFDVGESERALCTALRQVLKTRR